MKRRLICRTLAGVCLAAMAPSLAMAQLEAMGYLRQPHRSAGRIPSQAGYRVYVDGLLAAQAGDDDEPMSTVRRRLLTRYRDLAPDEWESLFRSTCQLLSQLSQYIGVVIGWLMGLAASQAMASVYVEYFHFPYLVFVQRPSVYVIGAAAGLLAALVGAMMAVRRVVGLSPAVAMSPPAPTRFRRGLFDRLIQVMRPQQPTMMILRAIGRWPLRAATSSCRKAGAEVTAISSPNYGTRRGSAR